MSKHTPGPWKVIKCEHYPSLAAIVGPQNVEMDFDSFFLSRPEDMANAHLVASAPELLSSLKKLQALVCQDCPSVDPGEPGEHSNACFEAMEIIARAEGREVGA